MSKENEAFGEGAIIIPFGVREHGNKIVIKNIEHEVLKSNEELLYKNYGIISLRAIRNATGAKSYITIATCLNKE